ncbi:DUF4087 domain-containing protein [Phyllobacterium zundukense]
MFTRTVPLLVAAAMLFTLSAGLSFAQDKALNDALDNAFGSHDNYLAVINSFQAAVKAHDTAAVAAAVRYPIGVEINGKASTIKSASQFVKNYDAIMTREITDAVVKQKLDDLFVNWKGIMFGDGEIWINGICNDNTCKNVDIKVATIQSTANLAAPAPSGEVRCGWIENPTPGDLFLIDKDATWTITSQGQAEGPDAAGVDNIPDGDPKQFVDTSRGTGHGYSCGCLTVETNAKDQRITKVVSGKNLPLAKCRADKALPKP